MKSSAIRSLVAKSFIAGAILGLAVSAFPSPDLSVPPQRRGGGGSRGGGGGQRSAGGGGQRSVGGGGQLAAAGGASHARRETVRTPNFVQRSGPRTFQPASPVSNRSSQSGRPTGFGGQPNRDQGIPNQPNRNPGQPNQPNRNRGNSGQQGRAQGFPDQPNRTNQGRTSTAPNGHRFGVQSTPDRVQQRQFTVSHGERHYDNGLALHAGIRVTASRERHYFPSGYCNFPYYAAGVGVGAFVSPFGFYFGVCDPYISASVCLSYPPSVAYIDEPIYNGPVCQGFDVDPSTNLLDSPDLNVNEPGLVNAMDELTEAFQNGNIDALATIVSPNVSVAIYEQGTYKYSLSADNYMDLARDAIKNTHTVNFDITDLRQRSPNVFVVSGKQSYTDRNGQTRSVYFSDVLQDYTGQWTLTQVGDAPDRVQNLG